MEATDTVAFFIFMSMGKLRAFFSKKDQKKLEDGLANTKKSFLKIKTSFSNSFKNVVCELSNSINI